MTVRRLLLALLLIVFVAVALPAGAQIVSVYGMFTPVHADNVPAGSLVLGGGGSAQQYNSYWSPSFAVGGTVNLINLHFIKLGVDARGTFKTGTNAVQTFEVAARLAAQPPVLPLKPYAQIGLGYLGTQSQPGGAVPQSSQAGGLYNSKYATVVIRGGVDHAIFPLLDWRVAEIGYSRALNSGGNNTTDTFSLGTGLVVRF